MGYGYWSESRKNREAREERNLIVALRTPEWLSLLAIYAEQRALGPVNPAVIELATKAVQRLEEYKVTPQEMQTFPVNKFAYAFMQELVEREQLFLATHPGGHALERLINSIKAG